MRAEKIDFSLVDGGKVDEHSSCFVEISIIFTTQSDLYNVYNTIWRGMECGVLTCKYHIRIY